MTNTRQIATAYKNAKQELNNFRANGGDRHSAEYMKLMANVEGFAHDYSEFHKRKCGFGICRKNKRNFNFNARL